ncbi:MFS transporter [Deinococcus sp. KSM4-11]|uniref:MFS transporter n=1 Tax=Deinococcus sp. KSM4-11 TaxID=2568654 RepID=UPI001454CA72|nr:MFS transporter [Deinococcus sp. KSM4-11]
MAAFFINGAAMATWAANIPSVREHLHLSEPALGLVLVALAVGCVLALALAGRLSARFGSRVLTTASAVAVVPLLPALIAAPSVPLLVATLFVFGVGVSLMDVAMNAHGVLVEGQLRRPVMSSLHAMWSAGSLAGAGGASLLLRAGWAPLSYALLVAGVLAVLGLLALPRLLPAALDRGRAQDGPTFVLPSGVLLGVSVLVLLAYVAEGAVADWSAVYLRDALHADRGVAVGGFVAFNVAMLTARLVGDRLRAWMSAVTLLRTSGLLAAVGMVLALLAPVPALAFLGFALCGFGFSNVVPVMFSAAGAVPGIPAATAVAAAAGAGYVGFLVGPPLIGGLAGAVSLRVALLLVVVFAALIAAFAGVVGRSRVIPATSVTGG